MGIHQAVRPNTFQVEHQLSIWLFYSPESSEQTNDLLENTKLTGVCQKTQFFLYKWILCVYVSYYSYMF